jgi:hypothetical protein
MSTSLLPATNSILWSAVLLNEYYEIGAIGGKDGLTATVQCSGRLHSTDKTYSIQLSLKDEVTYKTKSVLVNEDEFALLCQAIRDLASLSYLGSRLENFEGIFSTKKGFYLKISNTSYEPLCVSMSINGAERKNTSDILQRLLQLLEKAIAAIDHLKTP